MKRFVTSMICGLVGISAIVSADPSRPHLIVGIVVDQLRTDYIEYLQHLFGEKGFRSLMNQGVYMRDVDFRTPLVDQVSATSIIQTGNWPSCSGVPARSVWNAERKMLISPLEDKASMGNFTTEVYSPANLRISTITDEISIDGIGLSQIYSISSDPQQSVILAGHNGTSAVWLDQNTGKWATSTYYRDMPPNVTRRNYSQSPAHKLDTMIWRPVLPLSRYPAIPAQKRHYEFRHSFPRANRDAYVRYASSPKVNEEITDIAIEYINQLQLGRRDAMDVINIGYTAAPYKYVADGDFRLELQDTYVRLDEQLQRLFTTIEKGVGLENTLIYLVGTGYYDDATPVDEKYKIPTGTFSVKRSLSLLNSFLSAKYGNGAYVDSYCANQIWLDHKEIEKHNVDKDDVIAQASGFVRKMSGVSDARPVWDVIAGTSPSTDNLRLALDPRTSGDILVEFMPGWTVKDDQQYPPVEKCVRGQAVLTPGFLFCNELQPQVIETAVDASRFAPTVAQTLRIRAPNGAKSKPLPLRFK